MPVTEVTNLFPSWALIATVVALIIASFMPEKPDVTNGVICIVIFVMALIYEIKNNNTKGIFKATIEEIDFQTLLLLGGLFIIIQGITNVGLIEDIGNIFVAVCLLFFAFSTILSWNFFGKVNVEYLAKKNKTATLIYSVVAIAFIFLGTLLKNDLVWELTDFFNYLMVLPNAIALFALSKLVKKNANNK